MPLRSIILLLILCATAVVALQYTFRPPQRVDVVILEDGMARIGSTDIPTRQLPDYLNTNYPRKAGTIIVFNVTDETVVEQVVPVVNETEDLGYRRVELKTMLE